jgi:hypothetical protein
MITKNIFRRLPRITSSGHIEWIEWMCLAGFEQFITSIGANNTNIAELLTILLQQILKQFLPVHGHQLPALDKQVTSPWDHQNIRRFGD